MAIFTALIAVVLVLVTLVFAVLHIGMIICLGVCVDWLTLRYKRFSIRDLLIVTTAIAMILAVVTVVVRSSL